MQQVKQLIQLDM